MTENWRELAAELTQDRLRQDMHDLNNDMAGRDTGRIKRFVTTGQSGLETTADKDNAADFRTLTEMVLQAERERQEQIERLHREFERYDKATALALAEIDEEIALAEQEYKRIQDNATVLDDGTRVYRDKNDGHFYDEDDQQISSKDEIEAHRNYKPDHSSRQGFQSGKGRLQGLGAEREEIIEFDDKQNKREQHLKDYPEEADEIEQELRDSPAPDRVQKHYDSNANTPANEARSEISTSASKELSPEGGIASELALMPAFRHAAASEQTDLQPAQKPDIQREMVRSGPDMALG